MKKGLKFGKVFLLIVFIFVKYYLYKFSNSPNHDFTLYSMYNN